MKGLMIQGTSSDVGKSYLVTALCRIFADQGYKVAPFKSQNMSNNSYVTFDGKEIGRAQGVQAEAARQLANVHMNPILLKPRHNTKSEVVLHGDVYKSYSGMDYGKSFAMTTGLEAVHQSLDYIKKNYDLIFIEGAGSPAEVNLNHREIVNMRIAEAADVDVILVTDIDRGGSFASLVGTLELVFEHRHRIKGVIFNKFRGDIRLLQDGLDWFENYTKVPVIGVVPYLTDIQIDTEDSQSGQTIFEAKRTEKPMLDIGVIQMARVSNSTDVEPFLYEKDVQLRLICSSDEFGSPDAVVIPGTKSTIDDLDIMEEKGLVDKIRHYAKDGGYIIGLCGGFQVLGKKLHDDGFVDNDQKSERDGLGLLDIETNFRSQKHVSVIHGMTMSGQDLVGYEIHLGDTVYGSEQKAFMKLDDGRSDGAVSEDGHIIGTYMHHLFYNDEFRTEWLNSIRKEKKMPIQDKVAVNEKREQAFDTLAEVVEKALDMDKVKALINSGEME